MSKYTFSTEQGLGDVVSEFKPFCTLSPKRPIVEAKQVTTDVCGAKFSKLCGFCFVSKQQSQAMRFMIVYCPKTKNNHSRNERALSGWYCWKHIGLQNEIVMDKEAMKSVYAFDVDKFFQSDVFEKYLPIFQKQTQQALDTVVKTFVDSYQDQAEGNEFTKRQIEFYVKCVRDSISKMGDVQKSFFGAKLAYNANKVYSLDMKEDEEKYDPPYTMDQIRDNYPEEVYAELSSCPIHSWRANTGIELIHKEPSRDELERIWKNWNLMSSEMKEISDKKSLELFGMTNAQHYKKLTDDEDNLEESNGFPEYDFNDVGDLESFLNMCYTEHDMKDRDHLVFWDKDGREIKIVRASVQNNGLNFWFD